MKEEIQNEVEAPRAEEKESFVKSLWDTVILPALKAFWANSGDEILGALKKLGADLVKAVIAAIKKDKDEK